MPRPADRFVAPSKATAILALLLCLLSCLAISARFKDPQVAHGDTPAYLQAAWNLAHHGVLTEDRRDPPLPVIGREPGYSVLLAAMMRAGTPLAGFSPACLNPDSPCDRSTYRSAQVANVVMAMLAALLIAATAWRLSGWSWAGVAAGAYMLLNGQALGWRHYLVSDYLALLLAAALMALLAAWVERPGRWRALSAGLAWAALSLTKAAFLWLLPLCLMVWLALRVLGRVRAPRGAALLLGVAALVPALWLLRNGMLTGVFAVTDSRSGIALSTREVFNHLGPRDILCGFVYWTRGFGDGLARLLFAPEVWQPFQLEAPGGYYDVGQHRYEPWVARVAAEQGIGAPAAQAIVDRALVMAFLERPLGYLASFPLLVWRGIWIDEFIVLGLPALLAMLVLAPRQRAAAWAIAALPGVFNLLIYPAISLNIPRYQLTALPALGLAAGWAAVMLRHRWQLRRRWIGRPG